MEWVALITTLVGLAGWMLKWWWGRQTREQELLDAIHKKEQELNAAISKNNWNEVAIAHRDLHHELRVLLSKRSKVPPQ